MLYPEEKSNRGRFDCVLEAAAKYGVKVCHDDDPVCPFCWVSIAHGVEKVAIEADDYGNWIMSTDEETWMCDWSDVEQLISKASVIYTIGF